MADYISTTISIGGPASEDVQAELFELLDGIGGYAHEDGKAVTVQGEFSGGYPEEIIGFCKENGLHLWSHNDAKYDVDAEIYVYDPTTGEERQCPSNSDYEPLIDAEALAKFGTVTDALAYLKSFADNTPPLSDA